MTLVVLGALVTPDFCHMDRVEIPVKWPPPVEQSEGTSSSRLRGGLISLYSITAVRFLIVIAAADVARWWRKCTVAGAAMTRSRTLLPGEINRPRCDNPCQVVASVAAADIPGDSIAAAITCFVRAEVLLT
jgi:hypothetical protein